MTAAREDTLQALKEIITEIKTAAKKKQMTGNYTTDEEKKKEKVKIQVNIKEYI